MRIMDTRDATGVAKGRYVSVCHTGGHDPGRTAIAALNDVRSRGCKPGLMADDRLGQRHEPEYTAVDLGTRTPAGHLDR
jgi:hypothetical protein